MSKSSIRGHSSSPTPSLSPFCLPTPFKHLLFAHLSSSYLAIISIFQAWTDARNHFFTPRASSRLCPLT